MLELREGVGDSGDVERQGASHVFTLRLLPAMSTKIVSLKSLNGFFRPENGSVLRNSELRELGHFDFDGESLAFRSVDGSIYSDSWIGLIAKVVAVYGCE